MHHRKPFVQQKKKKKSEKTDDSEKVEKSASTSTSIKSPSTDTHYCDRDALFQKRYEEGYDIYDEENVTWLCCNHPDSIPDSHQSSTSNKLMHVHDINSNA